jgi:hypothetical protein
MRRYKNSFTMALAGLFLFVTLSTLTGCQTTSNRYIGKTVPEPNRIPLPVGKTQSSVWQTKDLVFQYTCHRESNKLSLTGELALDESYEQYSTIRYLNLWVHFLDSEGNILDSKIVRSVATQKAYTGEKKKWDVKSSLDLPLTSTAATFSYSGSVTGKGQGNWSFYKSPTT